ncbi:MAG: uridine kinase [Syntrophobacter sp.]
MGRYVIGVAGGTGAGKTALAEGLAGACRGAAVIIHEDRYYRDNSHLPAASRESLNYDHPEALDLDLLAEHVRELVSGGIINQPVYDYAWHTRSRETIRVSPARLIIVEGLFTLFNEFLWGMVDLKVFLDLEEDIRLSRRIERDTRERGRTRESVIDQWNSTVQPMHRLFIEPTRSRADMILSGGDPVADNVAMIRAFLASKNIL